MTRKLFNVDDWSQSCLVPTMRDIPPGPRERGARMVSAAGALFWRRSPRGIELLLVSYADPARTLLDDLGGHLVAGDETPLSGVYREVAEGTNGVITAKSWSPPAAYFYNPLSEYLCYLVEVRPTRTSWDNPEIFGPVELANNIARTIRWYPFRDLAPDQLAKRLATCPALMAYLQQQEDAKVKSGICYSPKKPTQNYVVLLDGTKIPDFEVKKIQSAYLDDQFDDALRTLRNKYSYTRDERRETRDENGQRPDPFYNPSSL